jgi:uncharacterized protein
MNVPETSFFLLGPRGTGKSTWVRARFPHAFAVDLLNETTFLELTGHADRLEAMMDARGSKFAILDEIQKVPSLLDEVHRLIESRGMRFALTGSSARKLKRGGANLLAGRAVTLTMHPFTPAELANDFDLQFAIKYGLLPSVWGRRSPMTYLRSYVGTYLRQEVQQEALVRNVASFHRFLEAASFSQGAVLNMQTVAKESGVNSKTVANYFDLLEDLLIAHRVPVFTRKAKRKLISHEKFYLFDAGVYRAVRPRGPLDSDAEIDGAAIETLLYQSLRAENETRDLQYTIHYWRTREGVEVDFVLYGERGLHAFEVKRSSVLRDADLAGLRMFCSDYPMAKGHLYYGGQTRYQYGNIEVVPLEEGLKTLAETLA